MRLRYTRRATGDLISIAEYIRERDPSAARRVRACIVDGIRSLLLFPRLGRKQDIEGVRKLITRKYRYLVYYTVNIAGDEITILAIQHPAQDREHDDG